MLYFFGDGGGVVLYKKYKPSLKNVCLGLAYFVRKFWRHHCSFRLLPWTQLWGRQRVSLILLTLRLNCSLSSTLLSLHIHIVEAHLEICFHCKTKCKTNRCVCRAASGICNLKCDQSFSYENKNKNKFTKIIKIEICSNFTFEFILLNQHWHQILRINA